MNQDSICSHQSCSLEKFEGKDKCILHCEKNDWENSEEKLELFSKEISEIISNINKNYDLFENKDETPYEKEYRIAVFSNVYSFENIVFPKITFEKFSSLSLNSNIDIHFKNCHFLDEIDLYLFSEAKRIMFVGCIFKKEINIENVEIDRVFTLESCVFYKKVTIRNCIFSEIFSFNGSKFKENLEIYYTKFLDMSSFSNCVLKKEINIEYSIFKERVNFLGISSEENKVKNIKVSNRETARIIKDSFEQQNNIIEANKFYALEMKEREKELNNDIKQGKNIFEWLVFKIHGLASNHSQDWILSFLWIIIITLGYTFLGSLEFYTFDKSEYIFKEIFISILVVLLIYLSITFLFSYSKTKIIFFISQMSLLLYLFFTNDIYFKVFADNINPFSILTGKYDFSILTLLYKITIAYLIYQLIISIRQNTRRK